jgi:hypothetical protein
MCGFTKKKRRVAQKWVLNTLIMVLLIICQKICVKVIVGSWYCGLFLGRVVGGGVVFMFPTNHNNNNNTTMQTISQTKKPISQKKLMHAMLERPNQR